jgi:hypothetical protein
VREDIRYQRSGIRKRELPGLGGIGEVEILRAELFGSGGSVSGGLDIRDAGGKSWYHRGNRGNVQFEEGRCRVENLSRSFR